MNSAACALHHCWAPAYVAIRTWSVTLACHVGLNSVLPSAACATPGPRPRLLRTTGGQRAGLKSGLHGDVVQTVIVGDEHTFQAKGQGQHVHVHGGKPRKVACCSGRRLSVLKLCRTRVHPFQLGGFDQHPACGRETLQLIELRRCANPSCQPLEWPMQQGRGVEHRAFRSTGHALCWKPSSKKHPPAKT